MPLPIDLGRGGVALTFLTVSWAGFFTNLVAGGLFRDTFGWGGIGDEDATF